MNTKKILIILLIIGIIAIGGYLIFNKIQNNKVENQIEIKDYTPQEEISEEELRKTIISLYFNNKETNTLMPEARLIDVKILAKNPYEEIVNLLIKGPKSDKLEKVIPEGTILNEAEIIGNVVYLDFSKEFIENHKGGSEEESKTIYSIVNTLLELNEVKSVRILINGEENKSFKDGAINFNNNFVKMD
mgnify:CR=1 FL=1